MVRSDSQRGLQMLHRHALPPTRVQHQGHVGVCVGLIRIDPQGLQKIRDRASRVALPGQSRTQVVVCVGERRIDA